MSRMDDAIRQAAGRLPSPTIPEDADGFTREAMRLGVPADLIDVTRRLVDGNLAGAALTSALTKLIAERPGLVSPGLPRPPRSRAWRVVSGVPGSRSLLPT